MYGPDPGGVLTLAQDFLTSHATLLCRQLCCAARVHATARVSYVAGDVILRRMQQRVRAGP
jgi:hypothetical protein